MEKTLNQIHDVNKIAILIESEVLTVVRIPYHDSHVSALFLNLSDIFVWGCSDFEPLDIEVDSDSKMLEELYELYKDYDTWAGVAWACKNRDMKPQIPIVNLMKKRGIWSDELESLPDNPTDNDFDEGEKPNAV